MHLIDLTIRHFRNIAALNWSPAPGLNLIWGENGQGKTNVLEAIHFALVGRSFRTRADEDCLPWERARTPETDAAPTLVQTTLRARAGERRLRVTLARDAKRVHADGRLLARLGDLWAMAAVVAFTPEDAGLFKGPPGQRRRFLDTVLSQVSRPYLDDLQRYGQALRQLNAVLKSPPARADAAATAESFHPALAESGAAIMQARAARLAEAAEPLAARYRSLGGAGALAIDYEPDLKRLVPQGDPSTASRAALTGAYLERLGATMEEGRRLDGHDLRRFGSQGQHRLAALALKLESTQWIEERRGESPILLLDDFGSELDAARREAVLAGLCGARQVFVTATHPGDLGGAGRWQSSRRMAAGRLEGGVG